MRTLYCRLRKSSEHRIDPHIQQMISLQTHFVLMAMVLPLRKLYDVIGCDHRIKNSVNMLLLESLRKCDPLLLRKFILSNYGNYFAEVVIESFSVKKLFLKISQNSQKNTCARVSFLKKLY